MQLKDKIADLQKVIKRKITYEEIAPVLKLKNKQAVSSRIKRQQELEVYEEVALDEHFKKYIPTEINTNTSSPITFYDVKGSCGYGSLVLSEPELNTIWLDNNLIYKILRTKPENLHIIQAKGDSMEGVDIFEDDILLVDKSRRNPMISGIYVFTTQNNEMIFIKRLRLRPDGILEVISENRSYETLYYTSEDLQKIDFQIKGRIIKNISRGL